jgi:hypothetical protein
MQISVFKTCTKKGSTPHHHPLPSLYAFLATHSKNIVLFLQSWLTVCIAHYFHTFQRPTTIAARFITAMRSPLPPLLHPREREQTFAQVLNEKSQISLHDELERKRVDYRAQTISSTEQTQHAFSISHTRMRLPSLCLFQSLAFTLLLLLFVVSLFFCLNAVPVFSPPPTHIQYTGGEKQRG